MQETIKKIQQATALSHQQAWWLLEFVTNSNRCALTCGNQRLSPTQEKHLDELIYELAINHKPLAYILGFVPFLDLELLVQSPTLIPRLETEAWVDQVIAMIHTTKAAQPSMPPLTILDIGTGTGCIALSLAQAFPDARVYAVDISFDAVELAQKNALKNMITNVTIMQSDLLSNIPSHTQFDLIVSNPPYIDPAIQLESCVQQWEDYRALFAENQGLSVIEQICKQARSYLTANSMLPFQLIMEMDMTQGAIVQELLLSSGFTKTIINKDQFDRDRTVWACIDFAKKALTNQSID